MELAWLWSGILWCRWSCSNCSNLHLLIWSFRFYYRWWLLCRCFDHGSGSLVLGYFGWLLPGSILLVWCLLACTGKWVKLYTRFTTENSVCMRWLSISVSYLVSIVLVLLGYCMGRWLLCCFAVLRRNCWGMVMKQRRKIRRSSRLILNWTRNSIIYEKCTANNNWNKSKHNWCQQ